MKKNYIQPDTLVYQLKTESLLDSASVNNINATQTAGPGSSEERVNFSREGRGFFDE